MRKRNNNSAQTPDTPTPPVPTGAPSIVVLTCEHASNAAPESYQDLLRPASRWLATHRGYDPGALPIAQALSTRLGVPLVAGTTTRLLIELNRSLGQPDLFSAYSAFLDDICKGRLTADVYAPFRAECRRLIDTTIARHGRVVHLSVHTFTPIRRGVRRPMHVGILFDPARAHEAAVAERWRHLLATRLPRFTIALNEPYLGTDDGHTTALRREFSDSPHRYAGLELEVRQDLWRRSRGGTSPSWKHLLETLAATFHEAIGPQR